MRTALILLTATFFTPLSVFAQQFRLVTSQELDIPTGNPYGVTYHNGCFWITDAMNGDILRMHKETGDLKTIKAPRKYNTGITFEGEYLWVLTDAWDTIAYLHHNLPKTQVYKLDPDNGIPLDSLMVPYYNVPEITKRFMLGLAYYDSSLLVSFNGGWGPCIFRLNEYFTQVCCAHPGGMEVAGDELWEIRFTGDPDIMMSNDDSLIPNVIYGDSGMDWYNGGMLMPLSLYDSTSMEDWSRAMQFEFYATDLAYDGFNFWLLDPMARKLKMMVIDTIHSDTLHPEPPPTDTIPGDSIPWPWYIDKIEVIPSQPAAGDVVSIVVQTTFPSGGCSLLEQQIVMTSTGISIYALHDMGPLDYICSSTDTFTLGSLPAGYYEVSYILSTEYAHLATEYIHLYVQDTVPLPWYMEIIPEKPVAGQEVKIIVHDICYINYLIDLVDRHITLEAYYNSCAASFCMTDTLSLGFLSEDTYTLDYFLYDICVPGIGSDSLVFYENRDIEVKGNASGTVPLPGMTIRVYPNPASHNLFLDIPGTTREWTVGIFSLNGRLLHQDRFLSAGNPQMVDLSGIPAGLYILKLAGNEAIYTQKISVLK
jgi:hypothetical protein